MENDLLHQILNKLNTIETNQQELKNEVSGLKDDVTSLKTDVTSLKAGQQELQYDVRTLKAGQEKLEAEITGIKSDISGMKSEIADIKKNTELIPFIKQAVSELSQEGLTTNEKVQKHESILETLSKRSIEHESELKRIK